MNVDMQLANVRAAFMATKRMMCVDHGGPYDVSMQVDVEFTDRTRAVGLIPDRDLIGVAVKTLAESREAEMAYVTVLADIYHGLSDLSPKEAVEHGRGTMRARFEQGDMSVTEALSVLVIEVKTGTLAGSLVPYRYDDHGVPKFGRPESLTPDDGVLVGAVVDELRLATGWPT